MTPEVIELIAQYRHVLERQYYWLTHPTHGIKDEHGNWTTESHEQSMKYAAEAKILHDTIKPLRPDWRFICGAILREVWFGSPYP